jgi:hypothetical protein
MRDADAGVRAVTMEKHLGDEPSCEL